MRRSACPGPRRRVRTLLLRLLLLLALVVVALNWTWGRLPREPPPGGRFAVVGGVRLHYLERAGSGAPVVLLHGSPGTAEDFERVLPLLGEHRAIALDRAGYGYSSGGYHDLDAQLATLEGLLDQLGIERAILVGHSYGGTLALDFAARRPERVSGLVLVAPAATGSRVAGDERAAATAIDVLSVPGIEQLATVTFSQLARTLGAKLGARRAFDPDPVDPAYERQVLGVMMQPSDLEAYAGEVRAVDGVVAGVDARLRQIAAPAVVIAGERDQVVDPRHARELARALPHARLEMVPGGHMVPFTDPAAVAQGVLDCGPGCGTH